MDANASDPFEHHLRLKRPCGNCPFRVSGAIELAPGRVEEILGGLLRDDMSTFYCHKLVHHEDGGERDDDGRYVPSGHEALCAGAAAVLMKLRSPTVVMRIGFATGVADPSDWDDVCDQVISPSRAAMLASQQADDPEGG